MKSETIFSIKKELRDRTNDDLIEFCLRLAKFKKENKELLTYLLFEADSEENYIENVKTEITNQLSQLNNKNYYWMRKGIRRVLKEVKKFIRYSQRKETEVELLLEFCIELTKLTPKIDQDKTLCALLERQLAQLQKKVESLHEDLQFDFNQKIGAVFS